MSLKVHLNLPPRFGQKLASAIINKFNSFIKAGLVSRPPVGAQNGEYSPATDIWLSPTWDGNLESVPQDTHGRHGDKQPTRLPSHKILKKRPARKTLQQGRKRRARVTLTQRNLATLADSDDVAIIANAPSPTQSLHFSEHHAGRHTVHVMPQRNETRTFDSNETHTGNTKQGALPVNDALDPSDLTERLEQIQSNSIAEEISAVLGTTRSATRHMGGELGPLREKEKICIKNLAELMAEFEDARTTHTQLLRQYETLKSELAATRKVLNDALRRQKAIAPTPGICSANASVRLQEATRASRNLLTEIQDKRIDLENRIVKQAELKSSLKPCLSAKRIQLKQLQDEIRELQKETNRGEVYLEQCDSELDRFQVFADDYSSGSMSPIECVPEHLPFEEDDNDNDGLHGASILANCTFGLEEGNEL